MPRPYDWHFTYHSALCSNAARDVIAYAVGHVQQAKVIIDAYRWWQRENGRYNWFAVRQQVWILSRTYHAESLLHDEAETEAIRLNLTDLDDWFVLHETPFTAQYRGVIFEAFRRRIIQGEILYPNDPKLLADLRAMPDDPTESQDASTATVANLSHHLYHTFVETREGLPDTDDAGMHRITNREWASDNDDDDQHARHNFGGGLMGGKDRSEG